MEVNCLANRHNPFSQSETSNIIILSLIHYSIKDFN